MKYFKLFITNIVILVLILLIFEFILHIYNCQKFPLRKINAWQFELRQFDEYYSDWRANWKRAPVGVQFKKNPVVIFGGSFAYCFGLKDSQTFAYKFSNLVKRPVYNYSVSGGCASHMLYMSQDERLYKEVKNPEYILYIWTDDEMSRYFRYMEILPSNDIYPRYKLKNGHTDFVKTNNFYNKLWSFYTVRFFQDNFLERQLVKNKEKTFELMKAIFIESREAQKKHWNTDRFIIFKYRIFWPDREGYIDCAGEYTDVPEWHKLRDEGFEIIDMKDLAGNSMCSAEYVMSKNDYHPNEKAWDRLAPLLAKRIEG